ncbi:hypothetical protein ACHAAC_16930 [Aeromicrobium sp. CF4.19]|uniref:hypothetical protein n=1 Tax=Aeromicrobium sp. CF4.19 TaxID=3373082 RepID=UPI003EE744AF
MSTRPVPVPRTCEAMYAVMTPAPIGSDDTLPLPHAALLRHHGTSDAAITRLAQCSHQHVVHARVPVERAAQHARDMREDVLRLAEQHEGVVVDLTVPRVLEAAAEDVSLAHSTQWYVLDAATILDGVVQTDGLVQFGLPEVRVTGVDAASHPAVGAVVAGLAHRLIAEWPHHDPVGPAAVTLRDIAHGLGDPQAEQTPTEPALPVLISYDAETTTLNVTLEADPTTTLFG